MHDLLKVTEVNETKVGLQTLRDFNNLFGYGLYIPALVTGENRKRTPAQHKEKYPEAMKFLENVQALTKYIKTFGSGSDTNSYTFRVNHIGAMKNFLNIVSRMQFMRALEDQIGVYREDDVGWGLLSIDYKYHNGKLVDTKVYLDKKELDLSKPIVMQGINWKGELVDGIQLIDRSNKKRIDRLKRDAKGNIETDDIGNPIYLKEALPVNLAIQLTEDSVGNPEIYAERERRYGTINKSDPRESMQSSPLDYIMLRIADDDADEFLSISGYETPLFTELDYCEDIAFLELARTLERYNDLVEAELDYNSRHFSGLNLFRWGILDKETWARGLAIFNAVLKSPPIDAGEPNDTLVDGKVLSWANAHISRLKAAESVDNSIKVDENAIISGTHITKIASTLSTSYFITHALVVTDIEEDDIGFKDVRIAYRSRPEVSRKFQSCPRTPTDLYKVVEIDNDGNIVGIINPVDIFAIIRHDITSQVVEFKSDYVNDEIDPTEDTSVKIDPIHQQFYSAIGSYK